MEFENKSITKSWIQKIEYRINISIILYYKFVFDKMLVSQEKVITAIYKGLKAACWCNSAIGAILIFADHLKNKK